MKVIGMLIISLWVDIAEICLTKGVPDSISIHNVRCHLQPWSKRLGTLLRKLGAKTHLAKLTHIIPLKNAWGCCYKGLFLFPSPPSNVDCLELKLECITSTLHWGGRWGGKMPQFDELLH